MYGEVGGSYSPPDWDDEAGGDGVSVMEEEDLHHLDVQVVEQNPDYWHVYKLVRVSMIARLPLQVDCTLGGIPVRIIIQRVILIEKYSNHGYSFHEHLIR